ncbi:uncharacterized protein [Nicotiana sylvestris]|uniref:uncharacterized protein n=1 Tax=Nicotiana sylvestris TaxID=4096 RepID=UPI00388C8A48
MAKYEACILGIRMAVDMNIKKLLVIRDFDMLIYQVQGEWTTKNVKIRLYLLCVKELCKKLIKNEFKHIPRNQNEFVDALATLSCMIHHPDKNNIDLIEIEVQGQHVYYFHIDEEPDGIKPYVVQDSSAEYADGDFQERARCSGWDGWLESSRAVGTGAGLILLRRPLLVGLPANKQ